ncbi:hypothetical protein PAXINDRAFT_87199, partial [Paxillus involutus ATCC 200175]
QERQVAEEHQRAQWEAEQVQRQAAEEHQRLQWIAEQAERQAAEEQQQLHWAAEQAERQAAEEQQQLQWAAEQAERQAAEEHQRVQWIAEQERQAAEAEQEHLRQEHEQQHLTQEHRERRPYQEPVVVHDLSPMDVDCSHCHALHFDSEKLSKSTRGRKRFGMCCLEGQVQLEPFLAWPPELNQLFLSDHQFVEKIRHYNSTLAFTSLGVGVDERMTHRSGTSSFRIHGGLHHLMGSLLPPDGQDPCYAQLYIYDTEEATEIRLRRDGNRQLDRDILRNLHDMLLNHHPYVNIYKHAHQVLLEKPPEQRTDIRVRLHLSEGTDGRRYNLSTANEITAVIPGNGSDAMNENQDIILRLQAGGLRHISHLHHAYSTLHYVLLFPKGEKGWHLGIPLHDREGRQSRSKKVTQLLYYAYCLHVRPPLIEPHNLFYGGRLFQQHVCDAWASVEQSNLTWIVNNQKKIRAELYSGLQDRVAQDPDLNLADVGRNIVLPSSHSGSHRHMQQLLQDSLAICRDCQKPDIFLTMTANPDWPEVRNNLLPGKYLLFLSAISHPHILL